MVNVWIAGIIIYDGSKSYFSSLDDEVRILMNLRSSLFFVLMGKVWEMIMDILCIDIDGWNEF